MGYGIAWLLERSDFDTRNLVFSQSFTVRRNSI